jgi:hypothetical protein
VLSLADAHLGPRPNAPLGIAHDDGELGAPAFLDRGRRFRAPRGGIRAAFIGEGRERQIFKSHGPAVGSDPEPADFHDLRPVAGVQTDHAVACREILRGQKRDEEAAPFAGAFKAIVGAAGFRFPRLLEDKRALGLVGATGRTRPKNGQHDIAAFHGPEGFRDDLEIGRLLWDAPGEHAHRLFEAWTARGIYELGKACAVRAPKRERHALQRALRADVNAGWQVAVAKFLLGRDIGADGGDANDEDDAR